MSITDADDLDWYADALCQQTDPETFFPEKGGSTIDAKRICRRCDAIERCLTYALEHNERDGVWGGLSPRERHALARGKPEPKDGNCPVCGKYFRSVATHNGMAHNPTPARKRAAA